MIPSTMVLILIFSLLQITFLPGFLLLSSLGIQRKVSVSTALIYSFALSHFANYFLVAALTMLGIYRPLSLHILIAIEVVCLAAMHRKTIAMLSQLSLADMELLGRRFLSWLTQPPPVPPDTRTAVSSAAEAPAGHVILFRVSFVLAAGLCAYHVMIAIGAAGSIFDNWDAVVSWNKWATEWAANRIPGTMFHYPQILPANWSLAYVLAGYPVQFVPRWVAGFFLPLMLLAMLDASLRSHRWGLLIGLFYTSTFFMRNSSDFAPGYADIPVAFFSLLSVTAIAGKTPPSSQDRRLCLLTGAAFAMAAALTKQAGLWALVMQPLFAGVFLFPRGEPGMLRRFTRYLIAYVAAGFVLVAPFYVFQGYRIHEGLDLSEIHAVTQRIFGAATYGERFMGALRGFLTANFHPAVGAVEIVLVLVALRVAPWRWIILPMVFGFFAVWGCFFSYDLRNVAILIPFFGIGLGIGIERSASLLAKFTRARVLHLLALAILVVILAAYRYPAERMLRIHTNMERLIYDPGVNRELYEMHAKEPFKGKIITEYQILGFLPDLKEYYHGLNPGPHTEDTYRQYLEALRRHEARYIMLSENANPKIRQDISGNVSNGHFVLLKRVKWYDLILIKNDWNDSGQ